MLAGLDHGSRPITFADVVSTGRTLRHLLGILQPEHPPVAPARGLGSGGGDPEHLRRVAQLSHLSDHQHKLMPSSGRHRWADRQVRRPTREDRTCRAPAEAVGIAEASRTPTVREKLVRCSSVNPRSPNRGCGTSSGVLPFEQLRGEHNAGERRPAPAVSAPGDR